MENGFGETLMTRQYLLNIFFECDLRMNLGPIVGATDEQ